MIVIQKVPSFIQILDLLYISYCLMGLTSTEIEKETYITFSNFIRSGIVLP